MTFPDEFDAAFYRARHADLAAFSDQDLRAHYEMYGRAEGRVASPACLREAFLRLAKGDGLVLEIGPFCNPCLIGRNVRYFDVLDRKGLLKRAAQIGYPVKHAPEIDFVSPTGDLSIVDHGFDAVVSSHCIEHQPDLVAHLAEVERILKPGGNYFLLVPDKRYCFDHFLAEATIAKVIEAHVRKRRTHTIASVIEHRALTTHNDPARHWAGDHADPGFLGSQPGRTRMAMAEYDRAGGGYVDVHAWQFTPQGFRRIIETLRALNLTGLACSRVYDTPHGGLEFTAILAKSHAAPGGATGRAGPPRVT